MSIITIAQRFIKIFLNDKVSASNSTNTFFLSPEFRGSHTYHINAQSDVYGVCGAWTAYEGTEVTREYIKNLWNNKNRRIKICYSCAETFVGEKLSKPE